MVRVRPPLAMIESIGDAEESVWRYPRPPRVEAIDRLVEIMLDGQIIAYSDRALRAVETSSPEVIYVPKDDLRGVQLIETSDWALCEWKGVGAFFDLRLGNRTVEKAGWHFPEPFDDLAQGYERLNGHVALFPAKFTCCLNGVRATPQEGGYYGGWITPGQKGPFKGGDGSENW